MSLLQEGQVLDGKYVIVRRIAEGGMSTIYLGVNRRIGKDVAVKVLHPVVARDHDIVERFEREARIVSRIRSAHVADVYDFGELPSGERFMVMEYLEGESLATILERDQTIPTRTLSAIAEQILLGLSAAHEAGVVHRDLKPENVIVATCATGMTVKLLDFGISKVLARGATHAKVNVKLTAANAVLGTPLYMSPEQARGNTASIDERTDIYSLGVMLYEAVAGQPPLIGENVNDLLFRVALDEPVPLAERVPSVDLAFAAIVTKAMSKDAADRYQSADEMRQAIVAWRGRADVDRHPPNLPPGVLRDVALGDVVADDRARAAFALGEASSESLGGTPTALTVPGEPSPNPSSPTPPTRSRRRRVKRMAIVVPLLGLALLSAPSARRAIVAQGARWMTPASESAPAAPLDAPPPDAPSLDAPPPRSEAPVTDPAPPPVDAPAPAPASIEDEPEPSRASTPRSPGPRASGVSSSRPKRSVSPRREPRDAGTMAVASTASAPAVLAPSTTGFEPPPSDPALVQEAH